MIVSDKKFKKRIKIYYLKKHKPNLVLQLKFEFQQPFIIQITLSSQFHY